MESWKPSPTLPVCLLPALCLPCPPPPLACTPFTDVRPPPMPACSPPHPPTHHLQDPENICLEKVAHGGHVDLGQWPGQPLASIVLRFRSQGLKLGLGVPRPLYMHASSL